MTGRVRLPADCAGEIFRQLGEAMPNEGCGLLLGRRAGDLIEIGAIVPSPNLAEDAATHFEIDPGLRLRTQRESRARGVEVVGHFHSHPFGDPVPSERDRAEAHEPELVWLIMGMRWGGPQGLAAWRLAPDDEPERLEIEVVDEG
ncbi:MAG: M67 family metallopeptidase [Minwuia sp.]|uniref:M67 family metallopeptidase n=1 Tax=Minwuia sp. TaxID=2493630 RepID=UPI003A85EC66